MVDVLVIGAGPAGLLAATVRAGEALPSGWLPAASVSPTSCRDGWGCGTATAIRLPASLIALPWEMGIPTC